MAATSALVEHEVATPEREWVTVRVGKDTKLHAMRRDGAGMCAAIRLMRMFSNSDIETVKVADGTDYVDCNVCIWGLITAPQASVPEDHARGRLLHRLSHRQRHLHAL
jgi:hypothetical protein